MKNIVYQTEELARYFNKNRIQWSQFYDSEKEIIIELPLDKSTTVLDIGCGCGGLGLSLKDKFNVEIYTGVAINSQNTETAKKMNSKAVVYCGDILDISNTDLKSKQFNIVFSLSCFDWNVRFLDMLKTAWNHVLPGGYLVATFRLTVEKGCNDFNLSYQYINYDGVLEGEKAAYVVLNGNELIDQLKDLNPSEINAFGYYGTPPGTAITPYKQLCFAAFSIQKRKDGDTTSDVSLKLKLPEDILASIK